MHHNGEWCIELELELEEDPRQWEGQWVFVETREGERTEQLAGFCFDVRADTTGGKCATYLLRSGKPHFGPKGTPTP